MCNLQDWTAACSSNAFEYSQKWMNALGIIEDVTLIYPKSYAIRHEAPIDWLVVDLVFDHFVTTDENVTLQANDWSHNFRIYDYK
uniref:Uncharacterized protein n=1 Tax=Ascaris lumbricoides TaxID=6252 RepID=A0A0M3HGF5_ASCLU